MTFIKKIAHYQFRNHQTAEFEFKSPVIGIHGNNGSGKTNLLDSIYYSCFTKSYFSKPDQQIATFGKSGFRIQSLISNKGEEHKVVCIYRENGKKEILLDEEPYQKFSSHIGRFPCVMVAPDDLEIIKGGSEERRKFLDTLLCQIDSEYLQYLITYNKLLQQRNSLLKNNIDSGNLDKNLLDVLDMQISKPGDEIFSKRKNFLQSFFPLVIENYQLIAGGNEMVQVSYESSLENFDIKSLLQQNREKDIRSGRTTDGIHKDDLIFHLGEKPFRQVGSQGQLKSLLFALNLSEFEVIKNEKGHPPVLLLDDIFEKLDETRMNNLLQRVCVQNKGQVFITDTHKDRLKEVFEKLKVDYQLIGL